MYARCASASSPFAPLLPGPLPALLNTMSIPYKRPPTGGGMLSASSQLQRDEPLASTSTIELNGQLSRNPAEAAAGPRPLFRAASEESTAPGDAEDDIYARPPPPKKQRKAPAASASKAKGGKGKGKAKEIPFVSSMPFPPHFVKLQQTFRVSRAPPFCARLTFANLSSYRPSIRSTHSARRERVCRRRLRSCKALSKGC